jgi:diguanylate cyclase (GGDEF)-like protein
MKKSAFDERQARTLWVVGAFLLIGVIGGVDYLTEYELTFSPFFLIPVFLATWYAGRRTGLVAAGLCALAWFVADYFTRPTYTNLVYYLTNTILRLFNFYVVVFLAARLKHEIEVQKEMAHQDVTTGLPNARAFTEFIQSELARATRYNRPVTVIYIDVDNFKTINDQYGHEAGNEALCQTAKVLRDSLRKVDFVARIGGDEFAAVLPETGKYCSPIVCKRIIDHMGQAMERNNWPVTLSLGAVTAEVTKDVSASDLIQQADRLMYQAKKSGKNTFHTAVYQPG